jgi:hypothetical protein
MVIIKWTNKAEFQTLPSKSKVDCLELINLLNSKGAEEIIWLAVW